MKEFRLSGNYKPGDCIRLEVETKNMFNPNDELVGHLSNDRCPNCGFKIYKNKRGNEWCMNCEWNNYKEKREYADFWHADLQGADLHEEC